MLTSKDYKKSRNFTHNPFTLFPSYDRFLCLILFVTAIVNCIAWALTDRKALRKHSKTQEIWTVSRVTNNEGVITMYNWHSWYNETTICCLFSNLLSACQGAKKCYRKSFIITQPSNLLQRLCNQPHPQTYPNHFQEYSPLVFPFYLKNFYFQTNDILKNAFV